MQIAQMLYPSPPPRLAGGQAALQVGELLGGRPRLVLITTSIMFISITIIISIIFNSSMINYPYY